MGMTTAEHLAQLAGHPERAADVPVEALPAVILELAAIQSALAARLTASRHPQDTTDDADRLITVKEASAMLGGVSQDFLYRSEAARALRVRLGGRVMFSYRKVQDYIRRRSGRA